VLLVDMFTPDNIGSYKAVKRYWSTDVSVGSVASYFADNIYQSACKKNSRFMA